MPRAGLAAWSLLWIAVPPASAQDPPAEWLELLRRVMPSAERFTDRRGQPPVFEAYARDADTERESLTGYAFLTSDFPPEQKGFNGPIEVLVGMDLRGMLTGVVVTRYIESHRATRGDFLAAEGFQEQFAGKSILEAFQVRRDVDGITGATITVDAMSRGVRNAARAVATTYGLASVSAPAGEPPLDPMSVDVAELRLLSWTQMLLRGLVQRISVLDGERSTAELSLLYLRDRSVAEVIIGPAMLSEALDRGASVPDRHLVLAGVDGPSAGALNLARLTIVQDGDTVGLTRPDVLLFGPPREGSLDGQVRMVRVLLVDRAVDMARPFTFVLDLRPGLGVYTAEYPGQRSRAATAGESGTLSAEVRSRSADGTRLRLAMLTVLLALLLAAFLWRRVR